MRDDEVIISIKDRGTGIDPDIKDKLFSKFATKSETGSGLGLFISKGIVEAHGGRIWAENNADGKGGATFSFRLTDLLITSFVTFIIWCLQLVRSIV